MGLAQSACGRSIPVPEVMVEVALVTMILASPTYAMRYGLIDFIGQLQHNNQFKSEVDSHHF